MNSITLMYHNMNVLLDVSSSKFFFPKLLLFLSDHLWHHFTITSKNVDPSRLKNGFHAGVDCFWPLPASPSHPPHRLTKNQWKAGIDPKIIQVSSKPWADHERLDCKSHTTFLGIYLSNPFSQEYEYLHNLSNADGYHFNSTWRNTPLNENVFVPIVLWC